MTAPNRSTLWGDLIVDELAKAGVEVVCLAPGSRCTPLTLAVADHDSMEGLSHLDERSAAFFALGRARLTGDPVAVVTTSGTAAANCHPAVIEAHQSRVPLVVLTADRPAELRDSGANQTIDQLDLYGDAVRDHRDLPEPVPEPRRMRAVRTAVARAVGATTATPPGPVHLNVPLPKPLEPTEVPGDVPADLASRDPLATEGREGAFVEPSKGQPTLGSDAIERIRSAIDGTARGLVVAGPTFGTDVDPESLAALADDLGFPILADPLSDLRFGPHVEEATICGGYDGYVDALRAWPEPAVVLRFGASPTSKSLRRYLADAADRQFVVDPGGGWPEAEFSASDLVIAEPTGLVRTLRREIEPGTGWESRFGAAETAYWTALEDPLTGELFEGAIASTVVEALPDPATLYVSNSMPVRDLDRYARPSPDAIRVLGNRGASGIDGITSSALGAAGAGEAPLVALVGGLADSHDTNGRLAAGRCGVAAARGLGNNDGGGIFHALPIEEFDPPFNELFRTPHDVDFAATGQLQDVAFDRVDTLASLEAAVSASVGSAGTQVIEIEVDAEASHRRREALTERAGAAVDQS
jgi:2-succinyl-5-enolpyruvyl-6-hydroxy-3-cyclohexene-1-carboxylate synthase